MRINVLVILGTRPEAIKLAPVVHELRRRPKTFRTVVCATAQHRRMLDDFLTLFEISPDHDLNLMRSGQTLTDVTVRALAGLDRVIRKECPDILLVQGDTTTAFCGALVGFYHQVRIGHVEAGLRTSNKSAPFPEEINRRLISQLADLHFAPTERAREFLLAEQIPNASIHVTGNTVIDTLLWMRRKLRRRPPLLPGRLAAAMRGKRLILVTGHRRENFGTGFRNICEALRELAERFPEILIVYPVHLNPNVRLPVYALLGGHPRIRLLKPVRYDLFVWLMMQATLILTDSGGIQEEGPTLGKPVLVMRQTTERPEAIQSGNAVLVGTDHRRIVETISDLLRNPSRLKRMASVHHPYGDGRAARRIVRILALGLPRPRLGRRR